MERFVDLSFWPEVVGMKSWNPFVCPLCNRIFRKPVILPCSHSFCEECIYSGEYQDKDFVCTVCHFSMKVYDIDTKPNRELSSICQVFDPIQTAYLWVEFRKHCNIHSFPHPLNCTDPDMLKVFQCLQCKTSICRKCANDPAHVNHDVILMDPYEYFNVCKELLKTSFVYTAMQELSSELNEITVRLNEAIHSLQVYSRDFGHYVEGLFRQMEMLLQRRKVEFKMKLQQQVEMKMVNLKNRLEAVTHLLNESRWREFKGSVLFDSNQDPASAYQILQDAQKNMMSCSESPDSFLKVAMDMIYDAEQELRFSHSNINFESLKTTLQNMETSAPNRTINLLHLPPQQIYNRCIWPPSMQPPPSPSTSTSSRSKDSTIGSGSYSSISHPHSIPTTGCPTISTRDVSSPLPDLGQQLPGGNSIQVGSSIQRPTLSSNYGTAQGMFAQPNKHLLSAEWHGFSFNQKTQTSVCTQSPNVGYLKHSRRGSTSYQSSAIGSLPTSLSIRKTTSFPCSTLLLKNRQMLSARRERRFLKKRPKYNYRMGISTLQSTAFGNKNSTDSNNLQKWSIVPQQPTIMSTKQGSHDACGKPQKLLFQPSQTRAAEWISQNTYCPPPKPEDAGCRSNSPLEGTSETVQEVPAEGTQESEGIVVRETSILILPASPDEVQSKNFNAEQSTPQSLSSDTFFTFSGSDGITATGFYQDTSSTESDLDISPQLTDERTIPVRHTQSDPTILTEGHHLDPAFNSTVALIRTGNGLPLPKDDSIRPPADDMFESSSVSGVSSLQSLCDQLGAAAKNRGSRSQIGVTATVDLGKEIVPSQEGILMSAIEKQKGLLEKLTEGHELETHPNTETLKTEQKFSEKSEPEVLNTSPDMLIVNSKIDKSPSSVEEKEIDSFDETATESRKDSEFKDDDTRLWSYERSLKSKKFSQKTFHFLSSSSERESDESEEEKIILFDCPVTLFDDSPTRDIESPERTAPQLSRLSPEHTGSDENVAVSEISTSPLMCPDPPIGDPPSKQPEKESTAEGSAEDGDVPVSGMSYREALLCKKKEPAGNLTVLRKQKPAITRRESSSSTSQKGNSPHSIRDGSGDSQSMIEEDQGESGSVWRKVQTRRKDELFRDWPSAFDVSNTGPKVNYVVRDSSCARDETNKKSCGVSNELVSFFRNQRKSRLGSNCSTKTDRRKQLEERRAKKAGQGKGTNKGSGKH